LDIDIGGVEVVILENNLVLHFAIFVKPKDSFPDVASREFVEVLKSKGSNFSSNLRGNSGASITHEILHVEDFLDGLWVCRIVDEVPVVRELELQASMIGRFDLENVREEVWT